MKKSFEIMLCFDFNYFFYLFEGSWRQSRGPAKQPCIRPSRVAQFRRPLDEGANFIRKSQTHQQNQWQWADYAEFPAQV